MGNNSNSQPFQTQSGARTVMEKNIQENNKRSTCFNPTFVEETAQPPINELEDRAMAPPGDAITGQVNMGSKEKKSVGAQTFFSNKKVASSKSEAHMVGK